MPRRLLVLAFLATPLVSPRPAVAQDHAGAQPAAEPAAVETVDGIIAALYASISGPAGPRDWEHFGSLFLPGAILMPALPQPDSLPPPPAFSAVEYRERAEPYLREHPFWEVEAARRVERFGTVVHVWSTYESREDPEAEPFARGINTITLVRHAGRWWVAAIVWDAEREGNPIPEEYLRSGPDAGL